MEGGTFDEQFKRLPMDAHHDLDHHQRMAEQRGKQRPVGQWFACRCVRGDEQRLIVQRLMNGDEQILLRLPDTELVPRIHRDERGYVEPLVTSMAQDGVLRLFISVAHRVGLEIQWEEVTMMLPKGVVNFIQDRAQTLVAIIAVPDGEWVECVSENAWKAVELYGSTAQINASFREFTVNPRAKRRSIPRAVITFQK